MTDWFDLLDNTANEATPGPWEFAAMEDNCIYREAGRAEEDFVAEVGLGERDEQGVRDAVFIARFDPDTVKHMLRVVRAAAERLDHENTCRDYLCLNRDGCPEYFQARACEEDALAALAEHVRKGAAPHP